MPVVGEPLDDLVASGGLENLDPLHREAVTDWAHYRLQRRLIERLDPDFPPRMLRVDALMMLNTRYGHPGVARIGDEPAQPEKGGGVEGAPSPLIESELGRIREELHASRLALIAQGTSHDGPTPPGQAQPLFVSYSHADKRFVGRLVKDLQLRGFSVWQDERELRVGESVAEKLREAIQGTDYFLLVVSPAADKSPWVKRELDVALNAHLRGEIRGVLPLVQGEGDLPSLLDGLLYADFRPRRYNKGLNTLLRTLDYDLDRQTILASVLLKERSREYIVPFLDGHGWQAAQWHSRLVRAEVTSGYLSVIRGYESASTAKPMAYPPHTPLILGRGAPILSGHGVQIGFSSLSRDMAHVVGPVPLVRATLFLMHLHPILQARQPGVVGDIELLLEWWDSPQLPTTPPVRMDAETLAS
jgi:hypothetical protein